MGQVFRIPPTIPGQWKQMLNSILCILHLGRSEDAFPIVHLAISVLFFCSSPACHPSCFTTFNCREASVPHCELAGHRKPRNTTPHRRRPGDRAEMGWWDGSMCHILVRKEPKNSWRNWQWIKWGGGIRGTYLWSRAAILGSGGA